MEIKGGILTTPIATESRKYLTYPALREFIESDAEIRILIGGIGTWKTSTSMQELAKYMLTTDVEEDKKTGQLLGKHNALVLAPTYEMLVSVIYPEFYNWFPQEAVANYSAELKIFTTVYGGKIFMRSADRPDRLRGLNKIGFATLDEARDMTRETYNIVLGRMYRVGVTRRKLIITTSMRRGYLDDLIQDAKKNPKLMFVKRISSEENPYYDKSLLNRLKSQYGEKFYRQEVLAESVDMAGSVFEDFTEVKNVITWNKFVELTGYPNGNLNYYRAIDFGYVAPSTCVWVAADQFGVYYLFRELYEKGMLVEDLAARIKSHQEPVLYTVADSEDAHGIAILNMHGVGTAPADKLGLDRHFKMSKKLAGINMLAGLIRDGKFKIVGDMCPNAVREFRDYRWREHKGAQEDMHLPEEPARISDHIIDPVRYLIYSQPPIPRGKTVKASDPNRINIQEELEMDSARELLAEYMFDELGVYS